MKWSLPPSLLSPAANIAMAQQTLLLLLLLLVLLLLPITSSTVRWYTVHCRVSLRFTFSWWHLNLVLSHKHRELYVFLSLSVEQSWIEGYFYDIFMTITNLHDKKAILSRYHVLIMYPISNEHNVKWLINKTRGLSAYTARSSFKLFSIATNACMWMLAKQGERRIKKVIKGINLMLFA